jgi:hypothetical protein
MIHTPDHASWLNQIEIFFSITQKKVISPNDFASLDDLSGALLAFADHYNQTAQPFNWKSSRSTGSTPAQTWPGSSTRSTASSSQPARHRPHDHPRRTYGVTHLGGAAGHHG